MHEVFEIAWTEVWEVCTLSWISVGATRAEVAGEKDILENDVTGFKVTL